ncbi:Cytochrome P450 [Parasphingorhabdus marina DSM 22363]|uniref:Cytochrome P450 n=1 Tax=Parasphingorhabdus marina DSM 22363 TaxID=1123272 RepID=A0A1N6HKW9_9SPHN|nr:cytochrome P450 [Parasphingorhabdus marina]SIO20393.1 Cytochrome P450 [Parasphingorhabdus marina DSM 22363]
MPGTAQNQAACPKTLDDVDLFGAGAQEHWYAAYDILHREAPVLRIAGEGLTPDKDAFILTKHEDISRVVKDWDRFPPTLSLLVRQIEAAGKLPQEMPDLDAMIISICSLRPTPELWRAHRQELTDPWVGPGAKRHEKMITDHVNFLIDRWINKGEVDFVREFARPLPQRTMASVLGFPIEDIPQLEIWGNAQVMSYVHGCGHNNKLTADQTREKFRLLDGFSDYVRGKTREKRASPQDDMISFLTQVHYQALDRKLTDDEINGVVYAMVIGGLETTQYAIAEQAQLICDRPGLFRKLQADRGLIRSFIEEGMRLRSPTQGLSTRITSQDEVFQGVDVPAGSSLHLRWAAANIDPEEFEEPQELKLDRKAVTRHLAFSAGPRVCPGAGLSRLEQTIAWNRLLDRLENIEYAADNDFLHQPGIMLGTNRLNLKFTANGKQS